MDSAHSRQALIGWDGASFRDRKGRIYHLDGRVFRVLSESGLRNWRAFAARPIASRLMADGVLVPTWEILTGVPGIVPGPVLEHERIPFVSYAFEWPFELLRRAALLHLELLMRLIPEGFILAHATPSNVMFRGTRPVFIDAGSVVPYGPGDVWQAFQQFLETMLYPLLLSAYKGVPYQTWLRGAGESGLPAWQVARLFGWRDCVRRGVVRYVKLGAVFDRVGRGGLELTRGEIAASGMATAVILKNLRSLEQLIASLEPPAGRSTWVDYRGGAYEPVASGRKRDMVRATMAHVERPTLVWDLGCNTGDYSLLMADTAGLVVAIDDEEPVLSELYRRCRSQEISNVLPLVIDVANPSPAQGWRGVERRALRDRGVPDLVIALGLLHHLVLTRNVPIAELLEELASTTSACLIEYIAPEDPMAQRLRRNAGEGRNEIPDRPVFEALAARHFVQSVRMELTSTRVLYLFRRR